MNITEAVNMILERYPERGYDAFVDLNKIKDDDLQEAVWFIKSMRDPRSVELSSAKKAERENFKKMIEKGYTYKTIAKETGLAERTVGIKVSDYGLKKLYYQMHPNVRKFDVKVLCTNRVTGEQREYKTMSAAERALGLYHCALAQNTKNGKAYVHGNWVFRRAN